MISSKIFNNIADFNDYPNDPNFTNSENWNSENYIEVIKYFRGYHPSFPVFDDLAVIVSKQTTNSWIFTTIHSPFTNNHSVSGHREFGFLDNGDGTYSIYTRAADRLTGYLDVLAGGEGGEDIFQGGDALWRSLLNHIIDYISTNSGSAEIEEITSNRYELD
jgi:hypothetical protein